MRMRLRSAALFTVAAALTAATITPADAGTGAPAAVATWSTDLGTGDASGVDVTDGAARLDQAHAFTAPLDEGGLAEGGRRVPTGLLTLPTQTLPARTDRVDSTVVGDVPAGSTASVDVRGVRANGKPSNSNCKNWSSRDPKDQGSAGNVNAVTNGGFVQNNKLPPCDSAAHLYCFEK